MKRTPKGKIPPQKLLGILAMRFRGTRDGAERRLIAQEYADVVARLVKSRKWREIPALEDQLPDDWMPEQFFEFWALR
jgi:hypothetical protein